MSKKIHFGGEARPKRDASEEFDIWNTEKKYLNSQDVSNTYINP